MTPDTDRGGSKRHAGTLGSQMRLATTTRSAGDVKHQPMVFFSVLPRNLRIARFVVNRSRFGTVIWYKGHISGVTVAKVEAASRRVSPLSVMPSPIPA